MDKLIFNCNSIKPICDICSYKISCDIHNKVDETHPTLPIRKVRECPSCNGRSKKNPEASVSCHSCYDTGEISEPVYLDECEFWVQPEGQTRLPVFDTYRFDLKPELREIWRLEQ